MTKDRLGDLQKIANTKPVDVDRHSEVETGNENDSLALSHFLLQTADIRESLDVVDATVADIKHIHADNLSSSVIDYLRYELENTTEFLKISAKEAKTKLKSLEAELAKSQISLKSPVLLSRSKGRRSIADAEESVPAKADDIIRSQFFYLVQRLCAILREYQDAQARYREAWKHRIRRQLRILGRSVDDDVLDEMIESQEPSIFSQGVIASTRQAKLADEHAEARRLKYVDALKLRKSNDAELYDLLAELETMASGQGEMVDNVEACMTEAKERVAEGAQQTREAFSRKRKARKKKFICGGIIAVIVAIATIIVIVVFSL